LHTLGKNRTYLRMALPIVEGYVIDTRKPWCASYARSEPNYLVQMRRRQEIRAKRVREKLIRSKLADQRNSTQKR
jgi:hypothetical protein